MKGFFSFAFICLVLFSFSLISAQEEVLFDRSAGITPDSPFYFVDEFFDRFSDDISNKEERIAELREMISEGKIDSAKEALERYRVYADRLESEIDPEKKEEAQRSAVAIKSVLEEIESEISQEDKEEFFYDILDKEERIVKAVEIADKVRDLCVSLSELDPKQYEEVCKTDEDDPQWQKDLDKELTKDQEREAKDFFKVMNQCFRTSGADCDCDKITVKPFAEKCSVLAPLAAACELEDDEEACKELDRLDEEEPIEDLLPDHLKAVFESIGGGPENFEDYAPTECIDAGATNEDECEEVLFKLHAPEECVQAGLDSHEDCERLLFQIHSPPECLKAGLENHEECDDLLGELYGKEEGEFEIHLDCREIEDSDERLECYDSLIEYSEEFYEEDFKFRGEFDDFSDEQKECLDKCSLEDSSWDLVEGECICFPFEEPGFDYRQDFDDNFNLEEDYYEESNEELGERSDEENMESESNSVKEEDDSQRTNSEDDFETED